MIQAESRLTVCDNSGAREAFAFVYWVERVVVMQVLET